MASLFGRQGMIGLDIGKSSIVGVQVAGRAPGAVLKVVHDRPIPEGLVFEGEVLDPDGLAAELKAFMREAKMKGKFVHLGVGNQKVIVRNIEVPEMAEEELRGAIEFQAQDYIPIAVEEVVLDFVVVNRYTDDDGVAKQQVLLVAAQKDMIQRYMDAARKAGLKVAGIDVAAFALIRSLTPRVSFVDQGAADADLFAIVNVSSSVSTLVIAKSGVPKFTRIVNLAYDNFTRVLIDRQGISAADADELAMRVGLPGPEAADTDTYNAATVAEVQTLLAQVADELAVEIRRSIDYYQSQDYAAVIDRVIVSGRGAQLKNLDAFLGETLGLRVEAGDPLAKVGGAPSEDIALMSPRLAVAVGLALEEVE
ncbi:MAG: type IV pilus assembly protein PilM [Actinobacteria bacterium]|nr:type IV pilus assembly protein PilM [Actinomycetota bacterium]